MIWPERVSAARRTRPAEVFLAGKWARRLEQSGTLAKLRHFYLAYKGLFAVATTISMPFLLCGWYYFSFIHIQWTHRLQPTAGLTYVSQTDAPQRNEFRKRTISVVCDPIDEQLTRIESIRRQTNHGTIRPPTLEQDLQEVRDRLKEIMTEARLRRIPKELKKNYEPAIYAILDATRSIDGLEYYFEHEIEAGQKETYNDSIKKWRSAQRKCDQTREFFSLSEYSTGGRSAQTANRT